MCLSLKKLIYYMTRGEIMPNRDVKYILNSVKIIKDFYLKKDNEKKVNAETLARDLSLEVNYRSLFKLSSYYKEKVNGLLLKLPHKKPVIYVEERLSKLQKQLTIFHEIGHYVLHWGINSKYVDDEKMEVAYWKDVNDDGEDGNNELNYEVQANIFATHLMFDHKNVIFIDKEVENKEEELFLKLYNNYTKDIINYQ